MDYGYIRYVSQLLHQEYSAAQEQNLTKPREELLWWLIVNTQLIGELIKVAEMDIWEGICFECQIE